MSEVHLETIVGRSVLDIDGKVAGRLEDVHADWRGSECIVTHYVLASTRAQEGFHWTNLITMVLRRLGAEKSGGGIVVPWDQLDLETMRLKCRVENLVGTSRTQ